MPNLDWPLISAVVGLLQLLALLYLLFVTHSVKNDHVSLMGKLLDSAFRHPAAPVPVPTWVEPEPPEPAAPTEPPGKNGHAGVFVVEVPVTGNDASDLPAIHRAVRDKYYQP